MQMHEGRYVWVDGKPKHVSQLDRSNEPLWFTCLGILLCVVAYLFG